MGVDGNEPRTKRGDEMARQIKRRELLDANTAMQTDAKAWVSASGDGARDPEGLAAYMNGVRHGWNMALRYLRDTGALDVDETRQKDASRV